MATVNVKAKKLIKNKLFTDTIGTKKNGNILCRWSYFYTHGNTAEGYVKKVKRLLTDNNISYHYMICGTHRVAFKGGASVANQSHFWVEVYVG